MALKTLTVADFRRLLDGLPGEQAVLLIDSTGVGVPILEIDPMTVTDLATGLQVLTLDFTTDDEMFVGFEGDKSEFIDSRG